MIFPIEALMQKRITEAFIQADATSVTLVRTAEVGNGAGGVRRGGAAPLTPQTVRLVPSADPAVAEAPKTDGGTRTTRYTLVAKFDANVKDGDEFSYEDETFVLSEVRVVGGYEKKATAVARG